MKIQGSHIFGIIAGVIVAAASYYLFGGTQLFNFLLVVGGLVAFVPFLITLLSGQNKEKEVEEKFLEFSRDLVENVRSGTPISRGIINLSNRNYGMLSPFIRKLANQLSIGITLSRALNTFAKDTRNRVISRAVSMISEAERAGGNIENILESVASSVSQIEDLRKERQAAVSNLITQGYMIFVIFIIIMLVMQFKILPLVSDIGGGDNGLTSNSQDINPDDFSKPLFVMLLVQSFFAGLVIGKISDGSIKSGVKHSFILLAITLVISTGINALLR